MIEPYDAAPMLILMSSKYGGCITEDQAETEFSDYFNDSETAMDVINDLIETGFLTRQIRRHISRAHTDLFEIGFVHRGVEYVLNDRGYALILSQQFDARDYLVM